MNVDLLKGFRDLNIAAASLRYDATQFYSAAEEKDIVLNHPEILECWLRTVKLSVAGAEKSLEELKEIKAKKKFYTYHDWSFSAKQFLIHEGGDPPSILIEPP